jgi:hypothetical protein
MVTSNTTENKPQQRKKKHMTTIATMDDAWLAIDK